MTKLRANRIHALVIVALGVTAATCRISDLGPPPPQQGNGFLAVTDSVVELAAVGSTTPLVDTLSVKNMGGGSLSWKALALNASPWLTLQPDSGVAGGTLQARSDPTGLALGEYRDTVIVAASTGGVVRVPVLFRIH
jgi:BACON domain-containing protein